MKPKYNTTKLMFKTSGYKELFTELKLHDKTLKIDKGKVLEFSQPSDKNVKEGNRIKILTPPKNYIII